MAETAQRVSPTATESENLAALALRVTRRAAIAKRRNNGDTGRNRSSAYNLCLCRGPFVGYGRRHGRLTRAKRKTENPGTALSGPGFFFKWVARPIPYAGRLCTMNAMRYLTIWKDEQGLSRAWGSADEQDIAEAAADIQADEYRKERPDVYLRTRETYEFLADDVWVLLGTRTS